MVNYLVNFRLLIDNFSKHMVTGRKITIGIVNVEIKGENPCCKLKGRKINGYLRFPSKLFKPSQQRDSRHKFCSRIRIWVWLECLRRFYSSKTRGLHHSKIPKIMALIFLVFFTPHRK